MDEPIKMASDRDVIGVEMFLIKHGYSKKKPKVKLLKDWACQNNIITNTITQEEWIYEVCWYIQNDFKSFREWFKSYTP